MNKYYFIICLEKNASADVWLDFVFNSNVLFAITGIGIFKVNGQRENPRY